MSAVNKSPGTKSVRGDEFVKNAKRLIALPKFAPKWRPDLFTKENMRYSVGFLLANEAPIDDAKSVSSAERILRHAQPS